MSEHIWIHDLSPFLLEFGGGFGIRYYSLAYILGLVWGGWLVHRWSRQGRTPLRPSEVQDLAVAVAIGMILGGRLGFVFFYDPSLLSDWSGGFPWWGVLKLHQGGMASHGGAIGMALAAIWFAAKRRRSIAALTDTGAVVIPIGVFLGRIANFINGELWGRPTDGSWGAIFPDAIQSDLAHRVAIGDTTQHLANQALAGMPDPSMTEAWQAFFFTWGVPRHPSQLYAAALEGLLVLAIALPIHRRHRRPGLSTGVVLATYSIARFLNEFYRQWDVGIEPWFGWLTRGQALSIPFFCVGLGLIAWAWRRGPKPGAYLDPAASPDQ